MGIFGSKSGLPRRSATPGWEGSDEAFLLAKKMVLGVGRDLKVDWIESANSNLMAFVKENRIKASDKDYQFVSLKTEQLWDVFREYMMSAEVGGSWNYQVKVNLGGRLTNVFRDARGKNKPKGLEAVELALLATSSLEKCFFEDKQLLSNAIFESIVVLWCHR